MATRPARYSLGAIVFHWLIAAMLVFQIVYAENLEGPKGPDLLANFQLHKSVGITILLLSVARLGWRFAAPRPAPIAAGTWGARLAGLVHVLFYVVMIGAPIAGWVIVSTARAPADTMLFGSSIAWPNLPLPRALHEPAEEVHELLANFGIGLLVLHVLGALRHQWLLRTPVLARMLPWGKTHGLAALALAAAILGAGALATLFVTPPPVPQAPIKPAQP